MAEENYDELEAAIKTLCTTLAAVYVDFFDFAAMSIIKFEQSVPRCIIPTGTFAAGVYRAGEDVHLVYMTDNTRKLFWMAFLERLQLDDENVKLARLCEAGRVDLSSPEISRGVGGNGAFLRIFVRLSGKEKLNGKVYLHYCRWPRDYNLQFFPMRPVPEFSPYEGDPTTERNLTLVRETQGLANDKKLATLDLREAFVHVYDTIFRWLDSHGLIGPAYGFLSADHLLWLVHDACLDDLTPLDGMSEISREVKILTDAFVRFKMQLYTHCARTTSSDDLELLMEKFEVSTTHNRIGDSLTVEAKEAIVEVLNVHGLTLKANREYFSDDPSVGFNTFVSKHPHMLKVECESWAPSLHKRAEFQEIDVPRNLKEIVEALREQNRPDASFDRFGISSLRIWPLAVNDRDDQGEQVLLIGIKTNSADFESSHEPFIADLHGYLEEYVLDYDRTVGRITIEPASRDNVDALIASKQVGAHAVSAFAAADRETTSDEPPSPASSRSSKFRNAISTIARLRFHPKHVGVEYEVGCKDRFKDELTWIHADKWSQMCPDDDDWIPAHRVKQLRRVEDGKVVWDREKRIDLT